MSVYKDWIEELQNAAFHASWDSTKRKLYEIENFLRSAQPKDEAAEFRYVQTMLDNPGVQWPEVAHSRFLRERAAARAEGYAAGVAAAMKTSTRS